ncbi:MAG: CRISPR system precrRNA processing endoribonuclease RAMP protein Cas6 [Desulfobacteraceae bacterium]|jgi:hypothetical protein
MFIGNYTFSCLFTEPALLPPYKGSTFRGVFGRALKKTVCALRLKECENCLLKSRCLYALVFETKEAVELPEDTRVSNPPHPFVIEPPLEDRTQYEKGEPFSFNLILFGDTNQSLPYFIYALDQMGMAGIGRRVNGSRGNFRLDKVTADDKQVYSGADQKINTENAFQDIQLPVLPSDDPEKLHIKVKILTPLRLKFENRLNADLPFHILIRAVLRRISSLFSLYDGGEPALDYKGLVSRSKEVHTVKHDLKWYDWRRYSFRQDKEMLMGGITGSVTYEGRLGEFIPLIELCRILHIGKQTAFGLGKYEMEILS